MRQLENDYEIVIYILVYIHLHEGICFVYNYYNYCYYGINCWGREPTYKAIVLLTYIQFTGYNKLLPLETYKEMKLFYTFTYPKKIVLPETVRLRDL